YSGIGVGAELRGTVKYDLELQLSFRGIRASTLKSMMTCYINMCEALGSAGLKSEELEPEEMLLFPVQKCQRQAETSTLGVAFILSNP
ncbi:hypothetical protein NDU88_005060, partial [Pleurodeles waltl]